MYETIVASAFALAGYKIEVAELEVTHKSKPEFWATAKSGKRFAVEAKCRAEWRAICEPADETFKRELQSWARRRIFDSSNKNLPNPIFWRELSMPAPIDEAGWHQIRRYIREAIDGAEVVLGARQEPPAPAYVFVTNNSHLVDDDVPNSPFFATLEPFLMPDFRPNTTMTLEDGMEMRDRHRDVSWVFDCLSVVQRIPQTFDGLIPELLDSSGKAEARLRIGSSVDLELTDGKRLAGVLTEIASLNNEAYVVVRKENGTHEIGNITLTVGERDAVRIYGDAIFGKPEKKQEKLKDVFALYDWFLEIYKNYDRVALLQQIIGHPQFASYEALPLAELRVRAAREVTKAAHHQSARPDRVHHPSE